MGNINKALIRWKEVMLITLLIKFFLVLLAFFVNQPKELSPLYYFVQWDGPHYVDIARDWYQVTGQQALWIVFYPLYPILINLFNFIINDLNISAIAVSLTFSVFASIALFELALLDFNRKVGILSVWFLNIFPTAYFLQSSYTESLFLTTSILTFYFYRKSLYISGIFGILSTMTRVNGLSILPGLLFENKSKKSLFSIAITALGFLFYLFINYQTFGDPLHFFQPLSSYWHKTFTWPWNGISTSFNNLQYYQGEVHFTYIFEFVAIIFIFLFTIFCYLKIRKSYAIYMLANLFLFTSTSFILSTPRYMLILFPIFIILGKIKNKLLIIGLSLIFLSLLVYFTSLFTQGKWAF